MPIFPSGGDGKPTAPITITDNRLVLPMDANGKPIVPYGPDGQPLIHVGPDNTPIETPSVPNVAGGGDWNQQYWNQYYQYWNYYNYANANVPYGGYPPQHSMPPGAGYPQPTSFANHSYVGFGTAGFGSGVKKPKVRPEDIDLPAGPAPPKKPHDEGRPQNVFDGGPHNDASEMSPTTKTMESEQKDAAATKSLISKQMKALALLQKYKKENETNESRSSSTGPNASSKQDTDEPHDNKPPPVKSTPDMYGPKVPPTSVTSPSVQKQPFVPATGESLPQPKESGGVFRNRWEPPPPGTQENAVKINPPQVIIPQQPVGRGRSGSREKSRSKSESRSRSRSRSRKRRSRSRSYSRSRSRSRSPYYRGGDRRDFNR